MGFGRTFLVKSQDTKRWNQGGHLGKEMNQIVDQSKFVEVPPYPCPTDAVKVSEEFYETMKRRRSVRNFSARPIRREILLNAIRTAGTAPNGANSQPWLFALIEAQELKDRIRTEAELVEQSFYSQRAPRDWLNDLTKLGTSAQKPYLSIAPALIAVFSRHNRGDESDERSYYPIESTGIAVGMLLTALHQTGLASLTHTPKPAHFLNEVLGIERNFRPFMLIAVGYAETPVLVPRIERKPLTEICRIYGRPSVVEK